MKKLFALVLATAMLGSCIVASADDQTPAENTATDAAVETITPDGNETLTATGTATKEVQAKYVAGEREDRFEVLITWGAMQFQYKEPDKFWDTEDLQWHNKNIGESDDGVWTVIDNSNTIGLVNRSSEAVVVTGTWEKDSVDFANSTEVDLAWDNGKDVANLASAAPVDGYVGTTDGAQKDTLTVKISGQPAGADVKNENGEKGKDHGLHKFGTITLTITPGPVGD